MKALSIIKYSFAIVGVALLAGAFMMYRSTAAFVETAVRAEGVVVDLERSRTSDSTVYRPVVKFLDAGGDEVEFVSSAGSNPPAYERGESVQILYRPENPQSAQIEGFFSLWGGALVLGIMGGAFFIIGGGIMLYGAVSTRRGEELKRTGTPIKTEFQGVELNESVSVNGRHPFRIVSQWKNPSTTEIHVFRSGNIWFDPSRHIASEVITVYIAPGNPRKYHLDISFLPKLAD